MQEELNLGHETLYTSVRIVDIVLSNTSNILKTKFQLLATTAIFMSCKFHVSTCDRNIE